MTHFDTLKTQTAGNHYSILDALLMLVQGFNVAVAPNRTSYLSEHLQSDIGLIDGRPTDGQEWSRHNVGHVEPVEAMLRRGF